MKATPEPAPARPEVTDDMGSAGMRTFFRIAEAWQLNNEQTMVLLGQPSKATFFKWKGGQGAALKHDTLQRLSYVLGIYRATIQQCLPGVKASAIHQFASEAFRDAGFKQPVALAGHGVGAWWHQQRPYMVPSSEDVIETGMVLAFEPHVNYWHLQDMFLISDEGQEILSPLFSTDEMLEVG